MSKGLTRRIPVGLVDDHPTVLAAIGAAITASDDLDLIGVARAADEAIELASHVDVLVCDMNLGQGAEGIDRRVSVSFH